MINLRLLVLAAVATRMALSVPSTDRGGAALVGDPAIGVPMAPVAFHPVRCAEYTNYVAPAAEGFELGPDRQQYGPRHSLPALAVFDRSGDPALATGIKRTLRHYGEWVDREIAAGHGVFSLEGASLLGVHWRVLRAHGQIGPQDEAWFRETLLKLRKYQYAWQPGDGAWRGYQHRALAQGTNNLLAAAFFPSDPSAASWRQYGEKVWSDWWAERDIGINDISYFSDSLGIALRTADLLGRREVFLDPKVRQILWDRLAYETSPDGALIPYGAHAGWNGLAGTRIWALEMAARYTRDGRYRYAASRLMNYGQLRGFSPGQTHWQSMSVEALALAALACDDSVTPIEPDMGSRVLYRPEVVRLSALETVARYGGPPALDSAMAMTSRWIPSKIAFRAGWAPGDLFMLVEAFSRHDPLDPTAILALEHGGASATEMIADPAGGHGNALMIEDLSGAARSSGPGNFRPGHPPLGFAGMETTVDAFGDDTLATHAQLSVSNYMGFRATNTREFMFVKRGLVVVRDQVTFDDAFRARVGPVWHSQVLAPGASNWVDTRLSAHWYSGVLKLYDNPPGRLLLYYAPRSDTGLTIRLSTRPAEPDTTQADAVRHFVVSQYAWTGKVARGSSLQFTAVLMPHAAPGEAAALAKSIRVLREEPGLSVIEMLGREGWQLIALNPARRVLNLSTTKGLVVSDAAALYIAALGPETLAVSARSAKSLRIRDRTIIDSVQPVDRVVSG